MDVGKFDPPSKRPESDVKCVKGTTKLHQIVKQGPYCVKTRRYSCFCSACKIGAEDKCINTAVVDAFTEVKLKPMWVFFFMIHSFLIDCNKQRPYYQFTSIQMLYMILLTLTPNTYPQWSKACWARGRRRGGNRRASCSKASIWWVSIVLFENLIFFLL